MSRIDDFIAHGVLPFVGREAELERILAFWRSVPEGQRLRLMLLTAEAGVGKSRLLEECLRILEGERGAVIHAKFYPEAANSPAPLLSRSLWKSAPGRDILRTRPGENLPEVIAGLQRLSRLRPTLLVLEDIHLLPSESVPDLMRLFDALADETISVLCLSRPATIAAQGVLETYLIESIRMEGIGPDALALLWRRLFDADPDADLTERLHAVTRGNALALRSGLRRAVQSGEIARSGNGWRLTVPAAAFEQGLRRSVRLVAEGMVAHLGKKEKKAAETLATLGEVFAREAAAGLHPDFERLPDELIAQGVIAETFHPVSPLAGVPLTEPGQGWEVPYPASDSPLLAFTHSLLHAYLAERAEADIPSLLKLVGSDLPLYSLLPLRLLEKGEIPEETDPDLLIRNIRRLTAVAVTLDRTASWRDGADLLKPMFRLLERLEARQDVPPETKLLWRMNAQHLSLSILRRSMNSPEWIALHERQLEITEAPQTLLAAQYRALAHSYVLDRIGLDKTYREGLSIIGDLDALLERFAELRTDICYVYILESLLHHAYAEGDVTMVEDVRKRTSLLLADPALRESPRRAAIARILPALLKRYTTPEELREREESIELIEQYQSEIDPYYGTSKIQFLGVSGRLAEAMELTEPLMRVTAERGLWSNFFVCWNWRIVCAAALGVPPAETAAEAHALRRTITDPQERENAAGNIAPAFALAGLLAGTFDEWIALLHDLEAGTGEVPEAFRAVAELERGNPAPLMELELPIRAGKFIPDEGTFPLWKKLAAGSATSSPLSPDEIARELLPLLNEPVLQLYDLPATRGTFALWKLLTSEPLPEELRIALPARIRRELVWLHERSAFRFMEPLFPLLEELGEPGEADEWKRKIATEEPRPVPAAAAAREEDGKIRISMLGAIRAALPGEELAPIRGVRIRALMGLMVADTMMGTPLTPEEFLALAGGKESDPEHARKKKNMAVVRLREIIGHDAILTDGPTPQLNMEIVSVDLLEIDRLLDRALEAARSDTFVRALPMIEEAVTRHGGDVPFPALYDDFFEAARSDFENRLRRGVLETGRGMLELGDAAGAEPLLRTAFEALPGDEEIADLLRQALERSGNRTEAERIRMRMEAM